MMRRLWSVVFVFITCSLPLMAQQHEQLWLDFQVDYPFANKYLFEISPAYQTVLSKENKWRSASLSATFEYILFTRMDLTLEIPVAYTLQKEGSNSWEVSPLLGTRLHITQNRRIDSRLLLRYQQRYFRQVEENDWDVSNRTRIKGEVFVCINGPNLFTDNLWYAILDYEEFIVLDEQLDERFANRRRARVGLSYRLNYKHRFEIIYTRQSSRNEIDGDFVSNDNVIQLRYKLYLNPSKPVEK
jgi:Protein of unknown function (DUF2490)